MDADTETVTKSVWVGSNKVPVESGDINTTDKYVGYDFEKTDPETLPESVAANSVIKVYYVKDLTDVRDLSYTVEYYKGRGEGGCRHRNRDEVRVGWQQHGACGV